jgi:hypothetical protein
MYIEFKFLIRMMFSHHYIASTHIVLCSNLITNAIILVFDPYIMGLNRFVQLVLQMTVNTLLHYRSHSIVSF